MLLINVSALTFRRKPSYIFKICGPRKKELAFLYFEGYVPLRFLDQGSGPDQQARRGATGGAFAGYFEKFHEVLPVLQSARFLACIFPGY